MRSNGWQVDEAPLLADRRDRIGEVEAARDLALEEQADHLALALGLHLLAGNDDQLAVLRIVGRFERTSEHVVVGDGNRAQALVDGVVDELGRFDAAVVRPRRVHVEVGDDPGTISQRVGRRALVAAAPESRVEVVQLVRDGGEALALGVRARLGALLGTQVVVLRESRGRRRGELGLLVHAPRSRDRAAGGRSLERDSGQPVDPRDEDRGLVQELRPRSAVAERAQLHALGERARDRRSRDQRPRPQQHDLPARECVQLVQNAAGDDALVRA